MKEIFGIILRLSVMYLYALVLIRITGKRSLGNLSAIDFVMTLGIGDLFDNAFWGTSPMSAAFVALGVMIFWHTTLAALSSHSKWFDHWITGSGATKVIQNGRFLPKGMRRERSREEDVFSALRLNEEDQLEEIRSGYWEPSGQLSVQKQDWAKDAQKQDLPKVKKVVR